MMLKKLISIAMAVIIGVSAFSVGTSAEVSVCSISSAYKISSLTISSNTARCKSTYEDVTTATVTATQTLEKHWGLWMWDPVANASWTKTVNNSSMSFSNTKSGLVSGTYRLKTVFTVTTSSGQTETVTVYSSEVTI